ncbi:hypothetical protein SOVF_148980, partial [Spinacia oleracea]
MENSLPALNLVLMAVKSGQVRSGFDDSGNQMIR